MNTTAERPPTIYETRLLEASAGSVAALGVSVLARCGGSVDVTTLGPRDRLLVAYARSLSTTQGDVVSLTAAGWMVYLLHSSAPQEEDMVPADVQVWFARQCDRRAAFYAAKGFFPVDDGQLVEWEARPAAGKDGE